MVGAIGIGGEVAPRMVEGHTCAPGVRARIVDVDFVGRIWRHSTTTHYVQVAVEVEPSRFASGSRYGRNRADGVSRRVEAEGVGSVHYRATLVI